jgi:tyrocidine synthetase-3
MFLNLFARTVLEFASKPALVFEEKSISYAELDYESGKIAYTLIANGIGRGDIVVIRLPRCSKAVAAILGVMKSGAAVCVTEEGYPQERIDFVMRDTRSKAVIDFNWLEQLPAKPQPVSFSEWQKDDPAIVVYTSGSTGNPKGVVNSHRALSMAVRGNTLSRTKQDTFLSVASFSFIAVVLEILTPLSLGGTIHIAGDNLRKDVEALVD